MFFDWVLYPFLIQNITYSAPAPEVLFQSIPNSRVVKYMSLSSSKYIFVFWKIMERLVTHSPPILPSVQPGHSSHAHFAGVPPLRSLETLLPSSVASGFQSVPYTTGSSSPPYHPLISRLLPKHYQEFSAFLLPQFLKAQTRCLFSHDLYNPHPPATGLPPQSVPENSNDPLTSKSKILYKILILLNP